MEDEDFDHAAWYQQQLEEEAQRRTEDPEWMARHRQLQKELAQRNFELWERMCK